MSFTRFHDDPCRIHKQLQESTDPGRWRLNVPGNGTNPCFMEDPFVRLEKWGANLRTNSINLESDLRGLTRTENLDCPKENCYKEHSVQSQAIQYPSCLPITEQSRATNPAWEVRDLEQVDWYTLPLNPQENTCFPFQNNLSTRILEKDAFVATAPCLNSDTVPPLPTEHFGKTSSDNFQATCNSTNSCAEL